MTESAAFPWAVGYVQSGWHGPAKRYSAEQTRGDAD